MKFIDRQGNITEKTTITDKICPLLYENPLGRMVVKTFCKPAFSRMMGAVLDSRLSVILTIPYKHFCNIDLKQCKPKFYSSFNEFFTRELKEELRPVDGEITSLISPADGKLSVFEIDKQLEIEVKQSKYSVAQLLKSETLAKQYEGGYVVVVRLTSEDNHHYCYVADGLKGKNHFIDGALHILHPHTAKLSSMLKENAREFCRIRTTHFGELIQMEVGAMIVGCVCNKDQSVCQVEKGAEKGYFSYGGSTVILLLQKDMVTMDADLLANTQNGIETLIKRGERIGYAGKHADATKFFSVNN